MSYEKLGDIAVKYQIICRNLPTSASPFSFRGVLVYISRKKKKNPIVKIDCLLIEMSALDLMHMAEKLRTSRMV